jgi:RNA recognition motif-containing protein
MPSKNDVPSVFVRNLPVEYTGDALSTLFSQIAPVKHAFIVRDRATKASKGYGFVQL